MHGSFIVILFHVQAVLQHKTLALNGFMMPISSRYLQALSEKLLVNVLYKSA